MSECPLIPMGAITGRPSREFIEHKLSQYRRQGITQFLLYPRSGCELEYMSEEWLDCCQNVVECAEKLGFTSVWLYDEFNWPSGQCGGKVQAAREDFALQTLVAEKQADGSFACRVECNPRFPNLLNPEAMDYFITLTHEKYWQRLGKYFGGLIKGIFTDEPSPGYAGRYCEKSSADMRLLSWYPGIEEDYEKLSGAPMRQDLDAPHFTELHHQLIGRRFRTTYFDKLRAWCDAHGILLTGHLMGESPVSNSKLFSGIPLQAIQGFSLPGLDEICTRTHAKTVEWLTFATARYGIDARGNGGLAELFAYGPADLPLARLRQMIWLAAAFGVDHYVLAVAQLDSRGNGRADKAGWYNPYSVDQPWFEHGMKELGDDATGAAALARKASAPEIAVRYPVDETSVGELLLELVQQQRPWRLIAAEDAVGDDVPEVIVASARGFALERGGLLLDSPQAVTAYLDRHVPRRAAVRELNGDLASELLLKEYTDGTLLVLDLSDRPQDRALTLDYRGQSVTFNLPGRGRQLFGGWKVTRDRPNLYRPKWATEATSVGITVQDELADVVFAIRSYGGDVRVALDGAELKAVEATAPRLSEGFQALYGSTAPMTISPGKHTLSLLNDAPEYPFLPRVWIAGDFVGLAPGVLAADRQDGRGLECYAGAISQTRQLEIPVDTSGFSLETDELVTEALVDGVSLGKRCWPPFFWDVPERYRGRCVEFTVRRYTSVAPAFISPETLPELLSKGTQTLQQPGKYATRHTVVEPEFF